MRTMVVQEKLEEIRIGLGLSKDVFYELTMTQLAHMRCGIAVGTKWTRGELGQVVADHDGETALEILQYLDERGPRVVDWSDDRVPCEDCQRLDGHSSMCPTARETVG
jgi:hypothetical protein